MKFFSLVIVSFLALAAANAHAQDSDFFVDQEIVNRAPMPTAPESQPDNRVQHLPAPPAPEHSPSGWDVLPIISYAPETSLAFGAYGDTYFRIGHATEDSRPSYVAAAVVYTTLNQVMVDLYPEIWLDGDRFLLRAQPSYRRMPDFFYGIGNKNPKSNEEAFTLHYYSHEIEFRTRVYGHFFVGPREEFQVQELLSAVPGGQLLHGDIPGTEKGYRSGFGAVFLYDSRDSTLYPHRGGYHELLVMTFQPWMGSSWQYSRVNADLRQYIPLFGNHVLAAELFTDFNAGNVPFNQLAMIGGANRERGYFEGRFRDKNAVSFQAEYRIVPLYCPVHDGVSNVSNEHSKLYDPCRFGIVAYAGIGEVFDRFEHFRMNGLHWSVGGGLRYALNPAEHVHVRLDVGVGADSWGLYVNVLEAF